MFGGRGSDIGSGGGRFLDAVVVVVVAVVVAVVTILVICWRL